MVIYSVSEKHRERRNALRAAFNSWGFGVLAPGVWIPPHPLSPKAETKWRELGVWQRLEFFRSEYLEPSAPHAWPQLPALRDRYQTFVTITLDDPALPSLLLPKDWPRPSVQLFFKKLQQSLDEPVERFFNAIYKMERETHAPLGRHKERKWVSRISRGRSQTLKVYVPNLSKRVIIWHKNAVYAALSKTFRVSPRKIPKSHENRVIYGGNR